MGTPVLPLGVKESRREADPNPIVQAEGIMGTRIPIFHQVEVTIIVAENDTPIWLQIERSNPAILAPQLLWFQPSHGPG